MKMANSKKPGKTCRQRATSKTPLKLRTILATTDFSDASRHGVQYAILLAARLGATVASCMSSNRALGFPIWVPLPPSQAAVRAVAERAWTTGTLVSLITVIEPGLRVAAEIPGGHSVAAARFGADIICIGSHARAGFTAKVLGSVSLADESIIEPNKSPSGNCP